jgi:hypothetical protein
MRFQLRTIAIILVAFFSCQLVVATVADPCALYSELTHTEDSTLTVDDNLSVVDLDSSAPSVAVEECEHCCHSSGHCHFLSLSSAPSFFINKEFTLTSSYDRSYQSRSQSLLHRPPIKA